MMKNLYIGLILCCVVAFGGWACYEKGSSDTAAKYQRLSDQAQREADKKLTQVNTELATLNTKALDEQKALNETISNLKHRVATGVVYVNPRGGENKDTGTASMGDGEVPKELDGAFVSTLVDIAERADSCALAHEVLVDYAVTIQNLNQ